MSDETIIYVKTPRVACSGENNDHPKVWYTVPEVGEGYVVSVSYTHLTLPTTPYV